MATSATSLHHDLKFMDNGLIIDGLTVVAHDNGTRGAVYTVDSTGYSVFLGTIAIEDWSWGEKEPIVDCLHEPLVILDREEVGYYIFGRKNLTDKRAYIKKALLRMIEEDDTDSLYTIYDGYLDNLKHREKSQDYMDYSPDDTE